MKKIIIIVGLVAIASCTKPAMDCKTVTQTRTNTRTGVTDTLMKDQTVCGNGLYFLKNGTREPFTMNDTTYYIITNCTFK